MTTIVHLARAEIRKLATSWSYLIALVISIGLAVMSVGVDAIAAGHNHMPALGTTASTDQMLKLGVIGCVAMLIVGVIASGGEYRHKTIVPAVLIAPRRHGLVLAKAIAIALGGALVSALTFGLGLATAVAALAIHHLHQLPPVTGQLYAGSVIAGTLFGLLGTALGYITRSTIVAAAAAVGWVLFGELAILHTIVPHQAKWLITGAATALTDPALPAGSALAPVTAVAVLSGYTVALLAVASALVLRRDVA